MHSKITPDPHELAAMVSSGMTAIQIGARYQTGENTARKWLRTLGLRVMPGGADRRHKGDQFRREVAFLARQGCSAYRIAIQLGVTFPAVVRCMEQHQIEPSKAISYVKPRRAIQANDPFGLCA